MTDIVLSIRLLVGRDEMMIAQFSKWMKQNYPKPSYADHAIEFAENVLKSAQIPFDCNIGINTSYGVKDDWVDFRHPKLGKSGKWFLDDERLENNKAIFIKLENQWIKGKVRVIDGTSNIVIEPENVIIPLNEKLFLRKGQL